MSSLVTITEPSESESQRTTGLSVDGIMMAESGSSISTAIEDTEKEALNVKLKPLERVAFSTTSKPSPKREALEVKLRAAPAPDAAEDRGSSTRKEALEVKSHLKPVRSGVSSGRRSARSGRSPRRTSEKLLGRMSSSLGIKPSQVKRRTSSESPAGVGAIKDLLAKQVARLAQLDEEMEHERKERERRERKDFLEQHLKARQEAATMNQLRETRDKQRAHDESQLHEIFDELLGTEETYLRDLHRVRAHYLVPLRELLSPPVHASIFSNLELLVQLHVTLAEDLRRCYAADTADSAGAADATDAADTTDAAGGGVDDVARGHIIAEAFLKLAPFFKMYAVYSATYASVPEALETARQSSKIDIFLRNAALAAAAAEMEAAPASDEASEPPQPTPRAPMQSRAAGLEQLLFRPVQRMCLYPLLFKQALAAQNKVDQWGERGERDEARLANHVKLAAAAAAGAPAEAADVEKSVSQAPRSKAADDTTSKASGPKTVQQQLEEVFGVIQKTLGAVNEDVRAIEAQHRTLHVLQSEVYGGLAFVAPDRVLRQETPTEMRAMHSKGGLCSCLQAAPTAARRAYDWYVFTDGVLICRNGHPLTESVISPAEVQVTRPESARDSSGEQRRMSSLKATHMDEPGAFYATLTIDGQVAQYECWADGGEDDVAKLVQAVHKMQEAHGQRSIRPGAGIK